MALTPHHTYQVLTKRAKRMAEYFSVERYVAIDAATREIGLKGKPAPIQGDQPAGGWPLPNVWLGTSVENQEQADARIPHLLAAPAAVRFLSCEPLLGPVDLSKWLPFGAGYCDACGEQRPHLYEAHGSPLAGGAICEPCGAQGLHWVIVGGESGHGARPMHVGWAHSLQLQCAAAGVAFFFKQWGEYKCFHPHEAKPDGIGAKQRKDWYNWPGGWVSVKLGKHEAGRHLDGRTWDDMPQGKEVAHA